MAKTIETNLSSIKAYLQPRDNEIFIIPEYQRNYTCSIEWCDKLWQDIIDFIDSEQKDPYFFGTLITECSAVGKKYIIDGQQRTTTFLLLCKSLQLILEVRLKDFKEDEDTLPLKEKLLEIKKEIIKILFRPKDDTDYFNLSQKWDSFDSKKIEQIYENNSLKEKYPNDLHEILLAKNFEDAEKEAKLVKPKSKKDSDKYTTFFANFKFFYEKVKELELDALKRFGDGFLSDCQVIEIKSWNVDQAMTMFNSLNSTGTPLNDDEIIFAELYAKADSLTDEKELDNFKSHWSELNSLSNDLEKKKIVKLDEILQEYMYIDRARNGRKDTALIAAKKYYRKIENKPADLANQLVKIARIWQEIKDNILVKLLLKFNNNAKFFLISYLFKFDEIKKQYVDEISMCLLRRFLILEIDNITYSSSSLRGFLIAENVNLVDKNYTFDKIQSDFNAEIQKYSKDKIKELIMCNSGKNDPLIFLNEFLYAKDNNLSFTFDDNVNIEHIMPASGKNKTEIQKDAKMNSDEFLFYSNSLGNKILLEEKINKSISNTWFKTKKQSTVKDKMGYKDSKYPIASALVNYKIDVWTKEDIEKANEKVANRIIKFLFGE